PISFRLQSAFEAGRHSGQCVIRLPHCCQAGRSQRIELAAAAAALGSWLTDPRSQEAFAFEAIERRVDGVDRDVASGSRVDLLADRRAVSLVAETQDAEEHELLEVSEDGGGPLKPHCGGYYAMEWRGRDTRARGRASSRARWCARASRLARLCAGRKSSTKGR